MKNKIFILCNSPQCLKEISAGNYPNLHESNIFTCNLAYTYFRTSGRHLNIFSDKPLINEFRGLRHDWYDIFGTYQYSHIEYIFHLWDVNGEKTFQTKNLIFRDSPITVQGSSAVNALLYLNACESFDEIHLVGYTLREWEGIKNVKELKQKHLALIDLLNNYEVQNPRDCVYVYKRKVK